MPKTKTRILQPGQHGQEINAYNVVFVIKLDKYRFVEVPASYCGKIDHSRLANIFKPGKTIYRHFHHEDKICPKNYKKVLFLGPKVKPGCLVTFPEPYSEARFLKPGERHQVSEIRLRHAM